MAVGEVEAYQLVVLPGRLGGVGRESEGGVERGGEWGGEGRACTILGKSMLLSIPPSSQP